ncbi:MAG TPA: glycosyltransferase family 4 protein [Actinomycetota bacterium]|nr:glycosyltransferase family 4 protein [Actinomycetota bacterium]
MKILVISSYPPRHCGIGSYAAADVERLRSEGHEVVVISPPDGNGNVRVPFFGGRPFLAAARLAPGFDRVLVHFEPGLYYRRRAPLSKVMSSLGLWWLTRRRPGTEVLVHEAAGRPHLLWRPDHVLLRSAFARANLLFHSDREREALERAYRLRVEGTVVPHTDGVRIVRRVARSEARSMLGVEPDGCLFLCAGFLHPTKGFERAVKAFQRAGSSGRLVLVGSVRQPTPEALSYVRALRELCERTPGVTLIEGYVSDEGFDTWIAAADVLVLPYRRAWSSGALARSQKLGTPAFVAAVGGMEEQAGPKDAVFRTDDELVQLLRQVDVSTNVLPHHEVG